MDTGSLTDQSVETVFGVSRSDVIAKLRANGPPLSVAEVAALLGAMARIERLLATLL